jgi:hypothetical protein
MGGWSEQATPDGRLEIVASRSGGGRRMRQGHALAVWVLTRRGPGFAAAPIRRPRPSRS